MGEAAGRPAKIVSVRLEPKRKPCGYFEQLQSRRSDAAGTYAKDSLPVLHKHLQSAESLSQEQTTGRR